METTRPSLLLRIRSPDDSSAWAEFDAIYRPLLIRFGQARGLSPADADDVAQHCMIAVLRTIQSFEYDRERGRFKSWLRTLANNRIRNFYRDRRALQPESAVWDNAADGGDEPDAVFDRVWLEEHMNLALRAVQADEDPACYDAFFRYAIRQEDASTVCRDSGLSQQQLYKLKWRLTRRLRERLAMILGEAATESEHMIT